MDRGRTFGSTVSVGRACLLTVMGSGGVRAPQCGHPCGCMPDGSVAVRTYRPRGAHNEALGWTNARQEQNQDGEALTADAMARAAANEARGSRIGIASPGEIRNSSAALSEEDSLIKTSAEEGDNP